MSFGRDYYTEMQIDPLDDSTADRLLLGELSPHDAPPGYAEVAAMLQAAASPASPAELVREDSIVAAGVAAVLTAAGLEPVVARRKFMLGKMISAKVAAVVATLTVLGAGTAAAAISGSLPIQATASASSHAQKGLATATSRLSHKRTKPAKSSESSSGSNSLSANGGASGRGPVGGMANGNATFGLCTAFLAPPQGTPSPRTGSGKDSSTAFKALIAAHGGSVSAATAFCTTYVANHHPGKAAITSPTTGTSTRSEKPGTPDKPDTAGASSSHAHVKTPNPDGTGTANAASADQSEHGTSAADAASNGSSSEGSASSTARTEH